MKSPPLAKVISVALLLSRWTLAGASAASLTVTNLADSGDGSLRQLITAANPGDTINFSVSGTITNLSGVLVINKNLTLIGRGAGNLAVSGNNSDRVFLIPANVTANISGFTIEAGRGAAGLDGYSLTDGSGGPGDSGGGIFNSGILTLNACRISGNAAGAGGRGKTSATGNGGPGGEGGEGGGVFNAGTLTLMNCTLDGNSAGAGGAGGYSGSQVTNPGGGGGPGGGAYNTGFFYLTNCTVTGNSCGGGGLGGNGIMGADGGDAGNGGGIYNSGGTLACVATTVAGNSAGNGGYGGSSAFSQGQFGGGGNGGGIFNTGKASLNNLLVAQNAVGYGGYYPNSPGSAPDLAGSFDSLGYNLISQADTNTSGFTNGVHHDLIGTARAPLNALLGPLTNNGGATPTRALLFGSPAFNAGDDSITLATDQRGFPRHFGAHVDIGAFEIQVAAGPLNLTSPTHLTNGVFQFTFTDNTPGASFTILSTTNPALPLAIWTLLSSPILTSPTHYQFTDAGDSSPRFYELRSP